jgi:hypothetical protein
VGKTLTRAWRMIVAAPGLILRAIPWRSWAHLEVAGLGVGSGAAADVEEREARTRREREIWRKREVETADEPGEGGS